MAVHFNEETVATTVSPDGVARQTLLNKERVPNILFELDRLTISPGARKMLTIAPGDLAWFQMLSGTATLHGKESHSSLSVNHIGLLPPGFEGYLTTDAGATLLLASVPSAEKLDPAVVTNPPPFRVIDWKDEPLLQSEHDARKRIYLVTPKMFGMRAIRGEMIIYPPNTECPVHFHRGGAHFMYFLAGEGTCYAGDDEAMPVRPGDVVYYHDLEPHWVKGGADSDMVFSEFFVPSAVATEWMDTSKICTWIPTGVNYRGGAPARELQKHSHSQLADV